MGPIPGWFAGTLAQTAIFVGGSAAVEKIRDTHMANRANEQAANLQERLTVAETRADVAIDTVAKAMQTGSVPQSVADAARKRVNESEQAEVTTQAVMDVSSRKPKLSTLEKMIQPQQKVDA